jgi:soluble lytic murein transglycosylase-like protein
VFCGVKIIGSYLKKYNGDYTKALMAYDMGEYGAQKAWQDGITTSPYSDEILSLMNEYEQELSNGNDNGDQS